MMPDHATPLPYAPATYAPLTFHDATPRFADGSDTPRAYLERCLATIAAREPLVQGFVTINEAGARTAADASTARWQAGRALSPIDGMPIGIKDLIETADMPTQMGSALYAGNFPKRDSAMIQALRAAGAVVLGKTVTTELGMSHPGPTTNPFDPTRTPGGSSQGSAAVVGATMVPAAIGTQVLGSIIRPAAFCANVALKPTQGALNRGERQGLSQSTAGVHAGCLEDMWLVAAEIAARAGGDPGAPGLYGDMAPPAPRQPRRLAVMEGEGWSQVHPRAREQFDQALATLAAAGVRILRRADTPALEAFERAIADSMALTRDVCAYEMRWTLENLVAQHADSKSGGGLSASLAARLDVGRALTRDDYRARLAERAAARAAHAALAPLCDALVSLSCLGPAPKLGDLGGSDGRIVHTTGNPVMNAGTSVLGCPAVTVPVLAVEGLPVGIQLIGQWHDDEAITGFARWMQGALR
jgi:Asp-tRNA(Asn)/Glu-tRNA(Gln) amidotransferase A subunit family amidase